MSKFTPGSWKVDGEWGMDGGWRIAAIDGGMNLHIAATDGRKENLSNAMLISAAPDMYEALRECIAALYEAIEIAPLDRLPGKAGATIQQAQYVLAKADGK